MTDFNKKHLELHKFIKFAAVGLFSTLIELVVFYVLQYVVFKDILESTLPKNNFFELLGLERGKGYLYAYIISTAVGYTLAFIINRKSTFNSDANILISTFLYILMVIFTIIATAWLGAEFQLWMAGINKQALGNIIGKPLVAVAATFWTYPLNRFVIHRNKKNNLF